MELSIPGLVVCISLFALGCALRKPLMFPFCASFAFGTTAIANLPSLSGASPLIFTVFALIVFAYLGAHKTFFQDIASVLVLHRTSFLVLGLVAYVCLTAAIFPRLFQGETIVMISRGAAAGTGVRAVPLGPSGGNVSQTAYFVLGALMYFAMVIMLSRFALFDIVRRGLIAWTCIHAFLGLTDLLSSLLGASDILQPVRTAKYALSTEINVAGFKRLVGGFPEASMFASATFGCLGFVIAYWRIARTPAMLFLSIILLMLLLLSTSTTAYVAIAIAAVPVLGMILRSLMVGTLRKGDSYIVGFTIIVFGFGLVVYFYNSELFSPLGRLLETMVMNKRTSFSAYERSYWNEVSLRALLDTGLLGVGMGSTRTSSWIVAVLSQLGVPGTILILILVAQFIPSAGQHPSSINIKIVALHDGARASALCLLLAAALQQGTADPGIQIFMALGIVVACRQYLRDNDAKPDAVMGLPLAR